MNKWAEIIIGLILIIVPIVLAFYSQNWTILNKSLNFWNAAWIFLKGGIFWFIVMIGLLFVLLGISDLRS